MGFQRASFLVVLLSLLLTASPTLAREWSDSTGKHSVDAEFVEIKDNKVVLKKANGKKIAVPIAQLSKVDQEYLRTLDKSRQTPVSAKPSVTPTTNTNPKLPAEPTVIPQDAKLAALLSQGSVVSISAGEQPLSSVLDQIEKDTGNRIRIMGDFGRLVGDGRPRFDRKGQLVPEKRIALDLQKKSFWEVADAVAAAADAKFGSLSRGALYLSTTGTRFGGNQFKPRAVGPSAVVGAFQVYPAFDDFFNKPLIAIRPEPRLGRSQVRSYTAEITLPNGKQIEYKPDMLLMTRNVHTGELMLQITPNLPPQATKAETIMVEAHLAVASDSKEFTLPPLGELMPKPKPVGKAVVYVLKAKQSEWFGRSNPSDELVTHPVLAVTLLAEGLPFDLTNVTLVDPAGNRVKSTGGRPSRQKNRQYLSVSFPLATISGDPDKCRLAFDIPDKGEKTIGPISDLAPKTTSVGAANIRVTMAQVNKQNGRESFGVSIEFDGILTPRQGAMLVGSDEQPLKSMGLSSGDGTAQFWFDSKKMSGKSESYRLRVHAPTKVTEFVLRAAFKDVPLTRDHVARR